MRYPDRENIRLPAHDLPVRPSFLLVLLQRPSVRYPKTRVPSPLDPIVRIHLHKQDHPLHSLLHKLTDNFQREWDSKINLQHPSHNILSLVASGRPRRFHSDPSDVLDDAKAEEIPSQ